MRRWVPLLAAAIVAAAWTAPAAKAARGVAPPPKHELQVFAAASLADAFGDIGRAFERSREGLVVRLNLAGSQQLAAQLAQGAVADVFASADERWMEDVRSRGLLLGDAAPFAQNRLVVIVPRTNPARIGRLQDLARGGIKLVLGADAVPVGRYSRIALRSLARTPGFGPDFATRVLKNVVSEEENVKAVASKVQLGEADAGIVYHSDVTASIARFVRVFELPEGVSPIASYPIALLRGGSEPDAARAFVELVLSTEGQRILVRHGLMPRAAPGAP
jgi:molybdate transport system substrate-binding protein